MGEKGSNAKYWWAVLYPENMRSDWKYEISNILEIPYAYCVHNKDIDGKQSDRKEHVHLILAFKNTTTYNHALSVFKGLNAEGKNAVNNCKRIINIRHAFDYLIHDTEDCKKKGKHLYSPEERIQGNNFDIGIYEQLSIDDVEKILDKLADIIISEYYINYRDFWIAISSDPDNCKEYRRVARTHHGFLEALTRGNYLHLKEMGSYKKDIDNSQNE